jgi:hypothetical protein
VGCRVLWLRFEWIGQAQEGGGFLLWFESIEEKYAVGGFLLLGKGVSGRWGCIALIPGFGAVGDFEASKQTCM